MKWLRNARVASAVGFLILIALIWFVGPLLGLKTVESRLGWIFAVMVLWVLTLLFGQLLAQRGNKLLEGMLRRQADDAVIGASADQRAEVALLRQRLLGAISTLKKSRLGNARGSAALYELPWYMIMGHPAAGKSSAILQSGLTFPFSDKSAIQGVGGTRNCDWFFSTEGVLLDTAGRYATHSEDRAEWIEFLKLLKKYRSKAPVNGILLAISLPELSQHTSEGFVLYARQMRERIHEIESVFGLRVPIYVVFTKLDLLGGFGEFFRDATEEERTRVWGATLNADQAADFDAAVTVNQQFELLYRGLVEIGEGKLAQYRGVDTRHAHFAFPIEFHGLKEAVVKFVRLLHEDNPYHSRPLLRGFYFTSALQEGVPRIVSAGRVKSLFDLGMSSREQVQSAGSYSFFLRDLFREVIFPDQNLIANQTRPAGSRLRLAGLVSGLALLGVLAGLWTWSYMGNQKWLKQVAADRSAAEKQMASADVYQRLQGLNTLQKYLEQIGSYHKDGVPFAVGMGLFQGYEIEPQLRREYFAGVRQVMLLPVKGGLETALAKLDESALASAGKPDAKEARLLSAVSSRLQQGGVVNAVYRPGSAGATQAVSQTGAAEANRSMLEQEYNALKTYLMLHDAKRMDEATLTDQIPRYWRPWLEQQKASHSNAEIMPLAEQLVAFYVSQIGAPDLPLLDNQADLVSRSREVLRNSLKHMSTEERMYNQIKAQANTRFASVTVGRILNNRDADVLAGSQAVQGAFTREAWDNYVRGAIDAASKGNIEGDDWVLAASLRESLGQDEDSQKSRQALEALYRADYAAAWKQFLLGVTVRDWADLPQAVAGMARASDSQDSPIRKVLERVAYETAWDNPSELSRSLESAKQSVLEKTAEFVTGKQSGDAGSAQTYGEVGAQFAGIAQLVKENKADASMVNYLSALGKVKNRLSTIAGNDDPGALAKTTAVATLNGTDSEFVAALGYIDNVMLGSLSAEARDMVRPLLVRPLISAYAAMLVPVASTLNQAWASDVLPEWKGLGVKYPFTDSANTASLSEISRFVKARGGPLNGFTAKYLDGLVQQRGAALIPRTWANIGIRFNPMFLQNAGRLTALANAQLQDGDSAKFELQAIPTAGLSEIRLDIDGQELRYRNGPQPWQAFTWPGNGGQPGARLQVVNYSGASSVVNSKDGRMGFMRLLSAATVDKDDGNSAQLSWRLPKSVTGSDGVVRVNFRSVDGMNPLQLTSLYHLTLPERVTN